MRLASNQSEPTVNLSLASAQAFPAAPATHPFGDTSAPIGITLKTPQRAKKPYGVEKFYKSRRCDLLRPRGADCRDRGYSIGSTTLSPGRSARLGI